MNYPFFVLNVNMCEILNIYMFVCHIIDYRYYNEHMNIVYIIYIYMIYALMKTNMKIEIVYLSNNNEYISSIFSCFLLIHSLTYIYYDIFILMIQNY